MSRTTRTSKVINRVLAPTAKGRDPEKAWAKAVDQVEQEAGHSDRAFADGLGVVVRNIAQEPRLTPLGWTLALNSVKDRYANRLRIIGLHADHPEISEEPITDPVFIVGLPRTATTLAHNVLAASASHRGPLMWEMMHTALEDPELARREIKKLSQGSRMIGGLLAPGLKHMHQSLPEKPEETLLLLPHGPFWSLMYAGVPGYQEWYASRSPEDYVADYECLKQGLQVLQHGRERKRWILKYPGHLNDMATIKQVFPDATFVWTHRDPTTVIGSMCSLVETLWAMYQDEPDRLEIGRLIMEMMSEWIDSGLESRLSLPPSSIVDVPYHKLSADPHTEVPRLYGALGATWTASDEAQLNRVTARPAGSKPHHYSVEDYGLDPARVAEVFAPYVRLLETFDVVEANPTAEM